MSDKVRLPVLMYHAVGPYSGPRHAELHVPSARFSHQLRWLRDHGFVGIAPRQCAAWLLRGEPLPERPVLLTFDDAYRDLTEHALPELVRHGYSAGVYVCTRLLGTRAAWDDQPLMTADDVTTWAREGIAHHIHRDREDLVGRRGSTQAIEQEIEEGVLLLASRHRELLGSNAQIGAGGHTACLQPPARVRHDFVG